MIHGGKCPKCDKPMHHVQMESVQAKIAFGGPEYTAASYQCPHCRTVLSIQIDPIALANQTAAQVVALLKKG